MILLLVDTLHQPTLQKYGDIHVCYKLNDFNLTSTESDFLRSPLDEVIEVVPPQGKLFFYQSQLSLLTLEVPLIKESVTKYNNVIINIFALNLSTTIKFQKQLAPPCISPPN